MKQVIILRGLPGSGKSTLAKSLLAMSSNCVICSADDYFMVNGVYKYNRNEIEDAHKHCFELFCESIMRDVATIIVDNTNTQAWEFSAYEHHAVMNGYEVHTIIVENRHGSSNVHNVPEYVVDVMKYRFEVQL
jgi:uridine kinase